ncbi:MAG TPA: fluoride efflux transporter CrcB [Vicinamibacteria bacterium]|nr:fluoride efflux transporter CrcB [Vicinamibacteria bacterium]
MMARMMPYILVGIGSSLGGIARLIVGRWAGAIVEGRFPMGTFLINVSGSFVLGVLGALLVQRAVPHADALRLAIGVGFCGGFTTFSTFEYETSALLEDGAWLVAAVNVVASVFAGLMAVRLGAVVGKSWL